MPEKGGIETVKELRTEFPHLTIFGMTEKTFQGSTDFMLSKMKKLGADRTFSKPLDLPKLLKIVQDTIEPQSPPLEIKPKKSIKSNVIVISLWIISMVISMFIGYLFGSNSLFHKLSKSIENLF